MKEYELWVREEELHPYVDSDKDYLPEVSVKEVRIGDIIHVGAQGYKEHHAREFKLQVVAIDAVDEATCDCLSCQYERMTPEEKIAADRKREEWYEDYYRKHPELRNLNCQTSMTTIANGMIVPSKNG